MKRLRLWLLRIALCIGLVWIALSCRYALRSGDDADVVRQWTASQYLLAGLDPYQVSLDVLRLNFGEMNGTNRLLLRSFKIYEVHPHLRTDGVANVMPDYGPPTATYPPSPLLTLTCTIGLLPKPFLLPFWLVVNLLSLAWLVRQHARTTSTPWLACATLLFLWPPTQEVIRTSQFGFLIVIWLLAALARFEKDPVAEAVFFSLVLLKPSLVLPFFALPLVRARWLTLVVAGAVHLLLSFAFSACVGTPLPTLLAEWVRIPGYMLQGAYTLQEIINRLGCDNTTAGTLLSAGFVGLAGIWCLLHRRADPWTQASFLAMVSLLWTYHERYDFILLLIPASIPLQKCKPRENPDLTTWLELAGYILVGLALTDVVYLTDHPAAHSLRWFGRLALMALCANAMLRVRRDHVHGRGRIAA